MPRRHRNARKDASVASVASVEATIAKLLGLPRKSVHLVVPSGRRARRTATINGLHKAWRS